MPMSPVPQRIHYREIASADFEKVVGLLLKGFRGRSRAFWVRALNRLADHATPLGFPKYGYLLECDEVPVGVYLQVYSSIVINGETRVRCSTSSLFVERAFQVYAPMLISRAEKYRHVTYCNLTPSPRVVAISEARGFVRYCDGRFLAIPALSRGEPEFKIKAVTAEACVDGELPSFERELLLKHAGYGCISVIGASEGRSYPFVFLPLRRYGVPYVHLAYCRQVQDFVRFAGSLGWFLAWRGYPFASVDSSGPIKGLIGKYFAGRPKYFKGPDRPRLGDIAYSERVMFGF